MTTSKKTVKKRVTKPRIAIDLNRVEALAARGLTKEQIADALGISETTLRNRQKESADFAGAIKKGRARGISDVANVVFEKAMTGDMTAAIFFLKTRAGWSEKQNIEVTGKDGEAIKTEIATPTIDALIKSMEIQNKLVNEKNSESKKTK